MLRSGFDGFEVKRHAPRRIDPTELQGRLRPFLE